MKEKIKLGTSDYTREEIENKLLVFEFYGDSQANIIYTLRAYEREGYTIVFKTNLLQRLFGTGKYKIYAIK